MGTVNYDPFRSGPIQQAAPTSAEQLAIFRESSGVPNDVGALEIKSGVAPQLMNLAFQEMLKRHEGLRSIFSADGTFRFIQEEKLQQIGFLDWSDHSDPDQELEKFKTLQLASSIDLVNGPCFFGTLIKLRAQRFIIVLSCHKIVIYGLNLSSILTELINIYSTLSPKVMAVEKIPSIANTSKYPVTSNQMQVWYLEEMYLHTPMHNLSSCLRMNFAVNQGVLEKSLQFLVKRHPALRTSIVVENGAPMQLIGDQNETLLKLDMIRVKENELPDALKSDLLGTFYKETAPLIKAKLYQTGSEDFVLLLIAHHSIWDAASYAIFHKELDLVYSALIKNEQPFLAIPSDINYGDYSFWMQKKLDQGKFTSQLEYWKTKLSLPLPVLELPSDFKRPITASHDGETVSFELSEQNSKKILGYAISQGTSVHNVLLTAFKITLSRYTNLDDIIVGTSSSARNHSQLENIIGYFLNTIALRSNINLNKSFEEILRQVNTAHLEALDNQDVPYQIVLNNIDYTRDLGRNPVFQSFFSFQEETHSTDSFNGHSCSRLMLNKNSTYTDLDLWISASATRLEGAFQFRKDLFKKITIERFQECFLSLVTSLADNVHVALSKQSALPLNQSQLILNSWNDTKVDTTNLVPFHKLFEATVSKYPAHLAVENSKSSVTYKELDHLANKVAQGLIKDGIGRGDLVGVSLSRDIKMMVALLGILKSGAGYVPLDPAFPQDRLDYMIESSTPKKLITEVSLAGRFTKFGKITLIDDLINNPNVPSEAPNVITDVKDTMYVIYTSGSTGNPKGVQISHGALSNFLISMAKAPGLTDKDKLLAVTTLSFDIATLEIYLPLIKGASLFLASSFDVIDGKALKNIIEKHHVNVMQATPSTWRLMLAAGWNGNKNFKVLCGGEPFPIDLALKLVSICGEVWNMYGPTETTVWSTCKKLSSSDVGVTIGRPINNTHTYILDEGLNFAPIGAPGELYIGGLGLAEGYFKRPDLTAERFVSNPFVPGEKMYATGDFARFTPDGDIECLGRQDGQVKVRGYRIELGEIEAVISKVETIKENAVITKETRPGDVRIIAYLVLKNGKSIDEKSLRDSLGQKIPKYMIPSHFVVIDDLPRTLNGKIDKKSLTAQFVEVKDQHAAIATEEAPTQDPVFDELRSMWKIVLGTSSITPQDNFFNVGGNSLLAVQLFSKIAQKYKLNLPLSLLLEATDFQTFVNLVKAKLPNHRTTSQLVKSGSNSFSSLVAIKASGDKNPVFCFHGLDGKVLNYMSLIPALVSGRPLIGLQSSGINGEQKIAESIEEMAKNYISEIKLLRPSGPYFLAGESIGGLIALEVAQQLTRQGEEIEKLVMIDTIGPAIKDRVERRSRGNLSIQNFFNKLRSKILVLFGQPISLEINLFNIEMNNYRAQFRYGAQLYDGELHLIMPKNRYSDPLMGWSNTIVGKITNHEIESTSGEFIENPELCKVFSELV